MLQEKNPLSVSREVYVKFCKSVLKHFRLNDCADILHTNVNMVTMQYFAVIGDLMMTNEEVKDLGNCDS